MEQEETRGRLWEMREHLCVKSEIDDPQFKSEVIVAAKRSIARFPGIHNCKTADEIIDIASRQLSVYFEEARSDADVQEIQTRYLEQRELGFAQLSLELSDPSVDAVLLKRNHVAGNQDHQYVAVLNLKEGASRAFWNRVHELGHRVVEPPQRSLFFRHKASKNKIEEITDSVAAEIGFFSPVFEKAIAPYLGNALDWHVVQLIRQAYCPAASLLATTKSIIRHWPRPVWLIEAGSRGRRSGGAQDVALRASVKGCSESAKETGVFFFPNMRVPSTSPIADTYILGEEVSYQEQLGRWTTSDGKSLPNRGAFVSARPYGEVVLALSNLL